MALPRNAYACIDCRLVLRRRAQQSPACTSSWRRNFTCSGPLLHTLRPATAPKETPDIKHIRQNPALYAQNCIDRNHASRAPYAARIQQLADEARQLDHDLQAPQSRMKQVQKSISKLAASNNDDGASTTPGKETLRLSALRSEAQGLKEQSRALSLRRTACTEEIQHLALSLPNLSSSETPVGDDPTLIGYINFDPDSPPAWTGSAETAQRRSHVAIGTSLGLVDFASSATTTGWGWYFLANEGALLEHALVQYGLSVARQRAWTIISPPSVVYSYIADACGFQPRDQHNEQQIWAIEQNAKDKSKPQRSLAGTAEIPLAAMYAGRHIDASQLPVRLAASSRCYRAEAGSRGVDTKGLYRVHEFTKVELFAWADNLPQDAAPEQITSQDLFAELLDIQHQILSSLNLPCRILEMPSTDLGASATRKRDIEALFPSRLQNAADLEPAWGEVTSASNCTDYQTRRLGTRSRGGAVKESRFPHTVNGTAVAVPRVLAAIIENGWDEERQLIVIPEVLRPWMGTDTIRKKK